MAVKTIHPSHLKPGMVVVSNNILLILLVLIPRDIHFKEYFIGFRCLTLKGVVGWVWDLEEDLVQIQV
jgi:hypothetical protein